MGLTATASTMAEAVAGVIDGSGNPVETGYLIEQEGGLKIIRLAVANQTTESI